MISDADLAHCRAAIRVPGRSRSTQRRACMPPKVRDPALVLYAFCRLADDAVDEHAEKAHAVLTLSERLRPRLCGPPRNAPEDRAFAAIVADSRCPALFPRRCWKGSPGTRRSAPYRTLSDVARLFCTGCRRRGRHDVRADARARPACLARACDLGVAMQLTNIARDVGEDARARRLYLPLDWMADAQIAPRPSFTNHFPRPPSAA